VITDSAILATYECDGLTAYRTTPAVVALPASAYEVRDCVRACRDLGVPFVRAAPAGPVRRGDAARRTACLIVTTSSTASGDRRGQPARGRRARRHQRAISAAVRPPPLLRARPVQPADMLDRRNVAETPARPCLKYGFTVHHVPGLEICTPDGELVTIGAGKAPRPPHDLLPR